MYFMYCVEHNNIEHNYELLLLLCLSFSLIIIIIHITLVCVFSHRAPSTSHRQACPPPLYAVQQLSFFDHGQAVHGFSSLSTHDHFLWFFVDKVVFKINNLRSKRWTDWSIYVTTKKLVFQSILIIQDLSYHLFNYA